MIYSRIKAGVWVKYEENAETGTVIYRRKLLERKRAILDRLSELPLYPTDSELLAWARANYPALDTSRELQLLNQELESIQTDLNFMVAD